MLKTEDTVNQTNNQTHKPFITLASVLLSACCVLSSPSVQSSLNAETSAKSFFRSKTLDHLTLSSPLWDEIANNAQQTLFVAIDTDDDHSWETYTEVLADNPHYDEDDNTTLIPFHREIQLVANELDADASLIFAVTKAESHFRPHAESQAGAVGLMQLIADRAGVDAYHEVYNVKQAPNEYELKDPYINLKLGTAYLKLLEEKYFAGVKDHELRRALVLAAYNWGPVNVKRYLLSKNAPRNLKEAKWVLWSKAPRETWSYVNKVLRFQRQYDEALDQEA